MMTDDELEDLLEREVKIAGDETRRLLSHWRGRNANLMVLLPVLLTSALGALRTCVGKELYDDTVRMVLARVEEKQISDKGQNNEPSRSVH
jgi:hypothetical protein